MYMYVHVAIEDKMLLINKEKENGKSLIVKN